MPYRSLSIDERAVPDTVCEVMASLPVPFAELASRKQRGWSGSVRDLLRDTVVELSARMEREADWGETHEWYAACDALSEQIARAAQAGELPELVPVVVVRRALTASAP